MIARKQDQNPTSGAGLSADQFSRAIAASNLEPDSLTVRACRLVLVDGLTAYQAAQRLGVHYSAVYRALKKIPSKFCPTCGQAVG